MVRRISSRRTEPLLRGRARYGRGRFHSGEGLSKPRFAVADFRLQSRMLPTGDTPATRPATGGTVVADHRADPGQRDLSAPGGAGHRLPRGLTTLAAPDSMRVLSFQILEPTMYVLITGSGVIFRKQIRVSPRRWDS